MTISGPTLIFNLRAFGGLKIYPKFALKINLNAEYILPKQFQTTKKGSGCCGKAFDAFFKEVKNDSNVRQILQNYNKVRG